MKCINKQDFFLSFLYLVNMLKNVPKYYGIFFHKIWLFNNNFSEENEISKKKK